MKISMIRISAMLFFVVSVIFSTIYTPQAILPILKQTFHTSVLETNLLLSGMLFVLMIITPFYIFIYNRYEKKKIMLVSTFFLFISVVLSFVATNFYILLLSRFMQGIFVPGITAIMLSYVQEIYPKSHRGLGMGIYMAATSFGAVIGRLLAGWFTYLYSWRVAFAIFAVLLAIAFVTMLITFPSVDENKMEKKKLNKKELLSFLSNLKIVSALIIPNVVFFSFMAISTFATYHLSQPPFNLDSSQLGNVFLVLLVGAFISPIAGKYSDKVGRLKIIYLGVFTLIFGMALTLSHTVTAVIIGIGFVTIGMFTVQSATPTYLGELVPNKTGTISILYQTFFYLGGCLGTLIPTFIWDKYQYNGVVIFCISLLLLGIGFFTYILNISEKDKIIYTR